MAGDLVDARIPGLEVRFENLDSLSSDDGASDAPIQLLALAAEHHAGNDFDPPTSLVEWSARPTHDRSRSLRGGAPPPRPGRSDPPRRIPSGRPRGGPPRARRASRSGRS